MKLPSENLGSLLRQVPGSMLGPLTSVQPQRPPLRPPAHPLLWIPSATQQGVPPGPSPHTPRPKCSFSAPVRPLFTLTTPVTICVFASLGAARHRDPQAG